MRPLTIFFLALLLAGHAVAQGPASPPAASLDTRVHDALAGFEGQVALFAKNLDTGAGYALAADQRVRTASTIKLPLMVEAFARVAEGRARWDEMLLLTEEAKVEGSGILTEFAPGLRLTLRDALHLMIVISDNTATRLLTDRLGADAVNARMDALGLPETRLLRRIGGGGASQAGEDPANRLFGLGVSTSREMVTLLEKLERGEVVSKDASREMVEILKRQQYRDGLGRTLRGAVIANKTGALDHLRSDLGLVYTEGGRIAMALTVDDMPEIDWTVENPGLLLLARLSGVLVEGLSRPHP
jgi:beta-lactamase class A